MTKNQFRLLTILSLAFGLGGIVWDFTIPLPPELEAYQASEGGLLDELSLPALLVMLAVVLVLVALSFVLLLIFHRWGPPLFVTTNVVSLIFSPFLGYAIYSPASEVLFTLSTLCAGAMIAIIYVSDVRKFFGKPAGRQAVA